MEHWYVLVPNFNTSAKDFYEAALAKLKEREVPGLDIAYFDFAEGGVLSVKREYLRMSRERLVFDICAAPFGTSFFFSCRFAVIPPVIRLWQILIVIIAIFAVTIYTVKYAGLILGPMLLFSGLVFVIYLLRNAVALGLKDLDAFLLKSPIVGPIYENWFRKETYYREDTRIMYRDTVNTVTKTLVEETTGAKGVTIIEFKEYSPIFGDLYKPTIVSLLRKER